MTIQQWLIVHFFEIAGYLSAIILIPRILLERRHPGATIAWLLAIGLLPFIGVPLYFLIGGKRIKRISKKRLILKKKEINTEISDGTRLPPESLRIASLLMNVSSLSPSSNNKVTIIDNGISAFTSLVDMLHHARQSIEIATFILGRDEVGKIFLKILAEKAAQGVEVRLLLDGWGSFFSKGRFVSPLKAAGGKVGVFLPLFAMRRRWSANLRNHRKMAIIDGSRAFVGGMNLAREYMGPDSYKKRWKDVALIVSGKSALDMRTVFMDDWLYSTGEEYKCGHLLPSNKILNQGNSIVQVVSDGPDLKQRPLYSGVLASINQARETIWAVTPYFVPDEPLSAALELAARMGRDVRIIIPQKSNHPLVDLASNSYLHDLIDAGVILYRYTPGMLHAKLITIDKCLAIVGSANMDMRSFQLNFEVATFIYTSRDVVRVKDVIKTIIGKSRIVTSEEMTQKSKFRRFSEDTCRVFSPLL